MSENPKEDGYAVGYGKPPRHSQFKPGQSGNPRGRPRKGESTIEIFERVMDEKVTVQLNGKSKKIPMREAIVRRFGQGLMKGGSVGNVRTFFEMGERRKQEADWDELARLEAEYREEDGPEIITMASDNPEITYRIARTNYIEDCIRNGKEPDL